jgi:glycosyltransferase involved in cell wall biosynthesis
MLRAAQDLAAQYPDKVQLTVAESLPFKDYVKAMNKADVILDQLYSYTPAMNALEAMSRGIIVVGGGEPENYDILHESELRPIINVEPTYDSVYQQLEHLVLHPELIPTLKQQSIEYIRRHHDYRKVAEQYISLYRSIH